MKHFLVQCTMHSYRGFADANWMRITFDTQELDAETGGRILACHTKFGHLYFKAGEDPISKEEQGLLDETGIEGEKRRDIRKSKSQQLRAVIYRMWEKNPEGLDSEAHYQKHMDNIMRILKDKYLER